MLLACLLYKSDISEISALDYDEGPRTALILTAHPDDEVMFFTPTILALLAAGWEVSALCLSTGQSRSLDTVCLVKEVLNNRRWRWSRYYQVVRASPKLQEARGSTGASHAY